MFVTDKSSEGNQFVKGFAGCGGFLRYAHEIQDEDELLNDEDSDSDSDFM